MRYSLATVVLAWSVLDTRKPWADRRADVCTSDTNQLSSAYLYQLAGFWTSDVTSMTSIAGSFINSSLALPDTRRVLRGRSCCRWSLTDQTHHASSRCDGRFMLPDF